MKKQKFSNQVEEIIQRLQEQAEDANYHDLYHIYQDVAEIVTKHAGDEIARKVMFDIEEHGGWLD